jgi:hypothetical protein
LHELVQDLVLEQVQAWLHEQVLLKVGLHHGLPLVQEDQLANQLQGT